MKRDTIRAFVLTKSSWILAARKHFIAQRREPPPSYLDNSRHDVWGKQYLMRLVERDAPACVRLEYKTLVLQVRHGTSVEKKHVLIARWYRDQVRQAVPPSDCQIGTYFRRQGSAILRAADENTLGKLQSYSCQYPFKY